MISAEIFSYVSLCGGSIRINRIVDIVFLLCFTKSTLIKTLVFNLADKEEVLPRLFSVTPTKLREAAGASD